MDCKYFGVCGGCSLPGIPYADQLAHKRSHLARLLGRDVPPILPSPSDSAFRQKAAFVFGAGARGAGLVIGHYARGSNHIVPVDECPVHSSRANRIAFALHRRLARARVAAADAGGILRHLIVRTSADDREAVVMLVVTRNDPSLRAPIRDLLASPDAPDGFLLNVNAKPGPYMVGPDTMAIAGRTHVRERAVGFDTQFLVSPAAFFQTNVAAARELVRLVVENVGPARRILDLYAGSGLFALPLAAAGATVTAVEENTQAVADLKVNVRLNRIPATRLTSVCARVERALDRLAKSRWDAVVLDPPRSGCAPSVLAAVFGTVAAPRVVYVSCNPDALAADLPRILAAGYRLASVQPVDMFPHTEHIETVAVFEKDAVRHRGYNGRDGDHADGQRRHAHDRRRS